jgi:hypothetical protein
MISLVKFGIVGMLVKAMVLCMSSCFVSPETILNVIQK